jgi:vacuolar-type H+-ATPase subunit I/STV1
VTILNSELYDALTAANVPDDKARAAAQSVAAYSGNGRFSKIDEQFTKLEERIDDRFSKIDERFSKIDDRFAKLEERLAKVEQDVAVLRWMIGTNLVLTVAILARLFVK